MAGVINEYPDDWIIAQKARIVQDVRDKIAREMGNM
jgi:hypothetical protein